MRRGRQIEKYTKLAARSTLAYIVFTALALAVVAYTTCRQGEFNERQLELYELSSMPQLFIRLDSLSFRQECNIFYTIGNAGNSPALNLRVAANIADTNENLFGEVGGEVRGDVFPGTFVPFRSKRPWSAEGTKYLHFRTDFEDLRQQRYFYKATYYLIFEPAKDSSHPVYYNRGMEYSEYGKLGR